MHARPRGLHDEPATTNAPLRILLAEDSENTAVELVAALQDAGYRTVCGRVFSRETLRSALDAQRWDVVICGSTGRRLDALTALAIVRGRGFLTPVIAAGGSHDDAERRAWLRGGVAACVRPSCTDDLAQAVAVACGLQSRCAGVHA